MKKLTLILILLVWLAGCNNNWKLVKNNWKGTRNNISQNNLQTKKVSHPELVSGSKVGSWELQKKKEVKPKKNSFSILKKELDKEFNNIYLSDDSNHYENSCYLLLDTDYKNKKFVLYRNKWAGIGTWWCKLSGVEKIWVMWYHNWKADPDGEYVLKSYDKKTGLFKYVMSKKYWNLWTWKNKYEFRFYLTGGKIVEEKVDEKISSNEFEKYWVYQILKDKCWIEDFDISKIPTESWEKIDIDCKEWPYWTVLTYNWNNKYVLSLDTRRKPIYKIYIKNWEIIKEWYWYNNKLYKSTNDIYRKYCSSPSKNYCWYCSELHLVKDFSEFGISSFYISGSNEDIQCNFDKIKDNLIYCKDIYQNFNEWKKIKVLIKKYKDWWFLLYTNTWKLLKIQHNPEADAGWSSIYKTFLNWKEVK